MKKKKKKKEFIMNKAFVKLQKNVGIDGSLPFPLSKDLSTKSCIWRWHVLEEL